jgi:hypothetical protein
VLCLFGLTVPLSVALVDPIALAAPVVAVGAPTAIAAPGAATRIPKIAITEPTLNNLNSSPPLVDALTPSTHSRDESSGKDPN